MKISTVAISGLIALSMSVLSYADDKSTENKVKDNSENTYENSTTRNPLTKTTTNTVTRKSKRKLRTSKGNAMAEDQTKVVKKTSDDGTKTSVRTETEHTNEESK